MKIKHGLWLTLLRRLEDKLCSNDMEMKTVQVTFSIDQLHGNRRFSTISRFHMVSLFLPLLRTFPQSIPAFMVCMDSTLGAKQGTLFRAPRNSDRPAAHDNVWTRSDYWNLLANKPSTPMNISYSPANMTYMLLLWCFHF